MTEFEASSCTGKVRFASHAAAKRVQKRRERSRQYRKGEVYRCRVCHGWHLGTRAVAERPKREWRRFMERYAE